MNKDGVKMYTEVIAENSGINLDDFSFPEEIGLNIIFGRTVTRYWGKSRNLILLIETDSGRKLKFSFWGNTNYCVEPKPKRDVDKEKESIRYLPDGTHISLTFERNASAKYTRIREVNIL